jgi:pimeloyl-ACP methyl ester carboxylesterase
VKKPAIRISIPSTIGWGVSAILCKRLAAQLTYGCSVEENRRLAHPAGAARRDFHPARTAQDARIEWRRIPEFDEAVLFGQIDAVSWFGRLPAILTSAENALTGVKSELVSTASGTLAVMHLGHAPPAAPQLIWGHGWNLSGSCFAPIAQSLSKIAGSHLIDFPGFGKSPAPPAVWGTAEYADIVALWLASLPEPRVWIGHSFGCRVGMQIAVRHPGLLAGLILIAAPGIPRRRTFAARITLAFRRTTFKVAKRLVPEGPRREALRSRFGSADYRSSGQMRPILVKVVNEDLSSVAARIQSPVILIYGEEDQDTPPDIGRRFHAMMPRAELIVLKGFDHLGLLQAGRHQIAAVIRRFLEAGCQLR